MEELEQYEVVQVDDYHSHPAISASKLKMFRASRRRYYETYITKSLKQKETAAMLLGTLVHCLCLEPTQFGLRYAVAPKCDRRTKEGKAIWAQFCDMVSTLQIVDESTYTQAQRIADAVMSNSAASKLLSHDGECETPIFWNHPDISGLECRAKIDKALTSQHVIIDVKTCQDATPVQFVKSIVSQGYDYQAAWYCEGWQQAHNAWPTFLFIAVQSDEPYEVGIYELSIGDLEMAQGANAETAAELHKCQRTGIWTQPHETDAVTLSLPAYARYRDDYRF